MSDIERLERLEKAIMSMEKLDDDLAKFAMLDLLNILASKYERNSEEKAMVSNLYDLIVVTK